MGFAVSLCVRSRVCFHVIWGGVNLCHCHCCCQHGGIWLDCWKETGGEGVFVEQRFFEASPRFCGLDWVVGTVIGASCLVGRSSTRFLSHMVIIVLLKSCR